MLNMATPKKPGRKKKAEAERYERVGAPLHVWLPKELLAAFERMRATTRRSKTAEMQLMMEQQLRAAGFWPPIEETG